MKTTTTERESQISHGSTITLCVVNQVILVATLIPSIFVTVCAHSIADPTRAAVQQRNDHLVKPNSQTKWLLTPVKSTDSSLSVVKIDGQSQLIGRQPSLTFRMHDIDYQNATDGQPPLSATTKSPSTSSERSWIESILIDVESMNFEGERQREQLTRTSDGHFTDGASSVVDDINEERSNIDHREASTPVTFASHQMSTDSNEDQLDSLVTTAATTMATPARNNDYQDGPPNAPEGETRLPLGRQTTNSSNPPHIHLSATAINDSLNTTQTNQQQSTQAAPIARFKPADRVSTKDEDKSRNIEDNEADRELIESNNVSAILTETQQQRPFSLTNHNSDQQLVVTTEQVSVISCEQAYTQCALRKVCAPALKAYNDDCQDLITNRTQLCSQSCAKSMIGLRSSDVGDHLANCDCQGNEFCLQSKQRSQTCRPEVEQAIDPKTIVSCSTATWICMADQLCATALDYYYRNCQSLFSQRHCSMRCNNSLAILYRQPKASKLISCFCDGSEEFPCVKYKTYTERLCLNRQNPLMRLTTPTNAAGDDNGEPQTDAANSEEETAADINEDDAHNLTNDRDDQAHVAIHLSPSDQDYGDSGGISDGTEERDAAASSTPSSEEFTTSNFNGIQPLEDNWIPLMSGWYFTNLHRQQPHQTQHQQRPRENHKVKHQTSATRLTSRSQQNRGIAKNIRQKTKSITGEHHAPKRGHSRTYMFALTSAAQPSKNKLMVLGSTNCWLHLMNGFCALLIIRYLSR